MKPSLSSRPRGLGLLAALWGVAGVILLLSQALLRLGPRAWEPLAAQQLVSWWHWGLYAASIGFNGYAEGYKGFQKGFGPRVAARAMCLAEDPRWYRVILAPAFLMGYFDATRRRMITSWTLTLGIAGLVLAVRLLDQPFRGMVDAGVVVGLGWGVLAVLGHFVRVLLGHAPAAPADLPAEWAPRPSAAPRAAA